MVLTDSLKKVHLLEQGYWVPVLRHSKFGFIDHRGMEMLPSQFERIAPEYLCGNIRVDYLGVEDVMISREGHWIGKGPLLEGFDLGSGFLKLNSSNCIWVIIKSCLSLSDK